MMQDLGDAAPSRCFRVPESFSSENSMEVRLKVVSPRSQNQIVVLRSDTLVGRSADCCLRIASSKVSRRHCRITVGRSSVSIVDLGSLNGTLLNGQAIPAHQLVELPMKCELFIGPMRFEVSYQQEVGRSASRLAMDRADDGGQRETESLDRRSAGAVATRCSVVDLLQETMEVDTADSGAETSMELEKPASIDTPE